MSRRPRTSIIGWAVVGAVVTSLVVGAVRLYALVDGGADLQQVPLDTLLVDVMELPWFALYGAIGGGVIGGIEFLFWLVRGRPRRERSTGATQFDDPDAAIKRMRTARAQRYLSARKHAEASVEAGASPTIETVVTARGGLFTYRVMAFRSLSPQEAQLEVSNALAEGRIHQPKAGEGVVLITRIGA